jgi:3-isopropylmalate/(R)-2-methylmalate dehydratase large subunit
VVHSGTRTWSRTARRAHAALHRPAPGARSHLAAGLPGLRERGLKVRRPDLTIATTDHSIPDHRPLAAHRRPIAAKQVAQLETNCRDFGIRCYGVHSDRQGIVHVIGPELGLTQPGMTVVCGDSHTATHGAFGALAFGIGTSEVEHVLATQCLLQRKSKTFRVRVDGALKTASRQGHHPGADRAHRHRRRHRLRLRIHGSAIRALDGRAHDRLQHVDRRRRARRPDRAGRHHVRIPLRPSARAQRRRLGCGVARWKQACPPTKARPSTASVTIDADALEPMITYGTNPGMGMRSRRAARAREVADPLERDSIAKALRYMGLEGGKPLLGHPVERGLHRKLHQFAHLRSARRGGLLKGRKVNPNVRVMVVPGSQEVKRQAIAEGLPEIFRAPAAIGASRAAPCASP